MAASFTVVPYKAGMEEPLRAIWNEVIRQGEAFVFTEEATPKEFREMLRQQTAVYCAVQGETIGGFYILHPNFPGRSSHVANASYAVSSAWRGRGLGRLLGEHSLEAARRAGFAAMQFNAVVATNQGANRLWHSLGFTRLAQVPQAFTLPGGTRTALNLYHRFL